MIGLSLLGSAVAQIVTAYQILGYKALAFDLVQEKDLLRPEV